MTKLWVTRDSNGICCLWGGKPKWNKQFLWWEGRVFKTHCMTITEEIGQGIQQSLATLGAGEIAEVVAFSLAHPAKGETE